MKVTIYKYLRHTANYGDDSYFYDSGDPTWMISYYDKLEMNRQLLDSFPIFREEWSQEDAIDILKTGYFDMKFAISMTERSATKDQRVYEFFENADQGIGKYKYLVVCESGNIERTYSGVIDTNTLEADLSVNERQYYISFSCTGIEKDLIMIMKKFYVPGISHDMSFENAYISYLLIDILSEKLSLQSLLDIDGKIGYDLNIDQAILTQLLATNTNLKVWDVFKSFVIGYGFKFKLIYDGTDGEYPRFKLVLFFRTEGINETTISKYLRNKKSYVVGASKYVAVLYTQYTDEDNQDIDHFTGFIMSVEGMYITNQSQYIDYNKANDTYSLSFSPYRSFTGAEVLRISLDLYNSGSTFLNNIAICRCVPGITINGMLIYMARTQLMYLLRGLRSKRNLTIKIDENSNITLGTKATIDNKNYTLERITSFDNFNNKMETEWIEE